MTSSKSRLVELAVRVYRIPLSLYPVRTPGDRERMAQTFRDLATEALKRGKWWLLRESMAECFNILTSAAVRRRVTSNQRTRERLPSWSRNFASAIRNLRTRHAWLVITTLGLGIGAATSVFSVFDSVLLRPLPYDSPDELVRIGTVRENRTGLGTLSPPLFFQLERQANTVTALAASSPGWRTLVRDGKPERVRIALVSGGFFGTLAVAPHAGRLLAPADQVVGAARTVVLSYDIWRNRYAGQDVIGTQITLDGETYRIDGVLPASFKTPEGNRLRDIDMWIPLSHFEGGLDADLFFLDVFGRLADGQGLRSAQSELGTIGPQLADGFGGRRRSFQSLSVRPLMAETVGSIRATLWMLLGAVSVLLAIAIANVAHLELARVATRRRELAVRIALGATRRTLAMQLGVESLLTATLGAGLGVALAWCGAWALQVFHPTDVPRLSEIAVSARVVITAIGVSVVFGVLACVLPNLRKFTGRLGSEERFATNTVGGNRLRNLLVTVQAGLAMMLLVGAGLLINSLVRLNLVPNGFQPNNLVVMTVQVDDPFESTRQEDWKIFFDRLLGMVRSIPGVTEAHLATGAPFTAGGWTTSVTVDGRDPELRGPDGERVGRHQITAGYLATMGMEVLRGREFGDGDLPGNEQVVVLNESLARRLFPGGTVLGERVVIGGDGTFTPRTVVGVVQNARYDSRRPDDVEHIYLPYQQFPAFEMNVMAWHVGDGVGLEEEMREALWSIQPDMAVRSIARMDQAISDELLEPSFYAWLLASFATVAVALAGVGIYGTVAYHVEQRRREIGVRLALGAPPGQIVTRVTLGSFTFTGIGLIAGTLTARWAAQVIEGQLFEVASTDSLTMVFSAGILASIGLAAALTGAARAAGVDVLHILRNE